MKDAFPAKDYKEEEDPRIFVSSKMGRGPLNDDWLDDYRRGINTGDVMCAYKLIQVEFKYWGMQVPSISDLLDPPTWEPIDPCPSVRLSRVRLKNHLIGS